MGVAHHLIAFFTRDKEQLGVDLQTRRGEDHVDPRFRQAFRPVNVSLFIEACLQLHHHGDFFTVMGGVDHRVNDARIFGYTVDVDFDRQYAGVERGLTQQLQHMLKSVIGIVEQDVAFADGVEAVAEFIKPQMTQARHRLIDQISLTHIREADKVFKVVVAAARQHRVVIGDGELIAQHFDHRVRHIALVDEANRLGGQALLEAGRHQLHQARLHLMHQIVLGVTGHFHRVGVQRIVIKEAFKDIIQAVA